MAETVGGTARRSSVRPADVVGRYTILERVGAGAMGVVYLANDPELERRVAIKVLHRDSARPELSAKRLRREARAMARLQHPNIVAVHDVGSHDGHVFVAMEFVRGTDLRRWVSAPRPWREVVEVMLQAARGLVAAHAAGVIHRDFKPDNVLVSDVPERRARVTDFGVAAIGTELAQDEESSSQPIVVTHGGGEDLSRTGGLVGTPAYLAAEQFAGMPADELTDQFAFCVSTWELVYGARPFHGSTLADLAMAVTSEEPRTPANAANVPAALRRILVRGLSPDRTRRWPSLAALADALERLLSRWRSRARTAAVALAVLGSAGVAAWVARGGHGCAPERELAEVWNDGARTRLHDAIASVSRAALDDLAPRVDARIDGWSAEWVGAQRRICEGPAGWSDALRDRATVCTARALAELRAMIEAVAESRLGRASQVLDLADQLPELAGCERADALLADVAPPTDEATIAEVTAVRTELATLRARRHAGEGGRAIADVDALLVRARASGYTPLVAEVLLEQGLARAAAGSPGPDAESLEESFYAATAAGDSRTALEAAIGLIDAIGNNAARPRDAMAWGRHAHALADALPDDPFSDARIDISIGQQHVQLAELDLAEPLMKRALEAYEATGSEREAAVTLAELGQLEIRRGDLDAATRYMEPARDRTLAVLGPYHPDSAIPLVGLGTIAMRRDDLDGAREAMREALAIYEGALGPDHPNVAGCLHNLGSIERMRDDLPAARDLLLRALAQRERTLGPDHPDVGATLGLLGSVDEELGDLALARSHDERALKIFVASYGEEHPRVADVLNNLGTLAIDAKDYDAAITALERARSIRAKTQGEDHPDYAMLLGNLARAWLKKGDRTRALELAQRALDIERTKLGDDHHRTKDSERLLAEIRAAQ